MTSTGSEETIARFLALIIAGLVAGWVRLDARRRGFSAGAAIGWSVGVFLMMILFLPPYLWVRRKYPLLSGAADLPRNAPPIAAPPCPYCGYPNAGNSDYCAKCGRQLKSSTEIHR